MTTNAIDLRQFIIASDSRWSYVENDHLIYVDDAGFDKIAYRQSGAMICAGSGVLINAWRDWFLSPMPSMATPPTEFVKPNGELDSITITVFAAVTGNVLYSKGWYLPFDNTAFFAGTGAEHAHRCFSANRCAKRSIGSAAQQDFCTGGETKFVHLVDGTNNLSAGQKELGDLNEDLMTKGMAMNLTTKNVVPFAEYAAGNGQAGAIKPNAANLSAPTGVKLSPWTEEDKYRLVTVVQEMVASEKKETNK